LRALLSFFTALPAGEATLEGASKRAYLLPLVGLLTGAPGAAIILGAYVVPPGVVATLALGAALLAAGLHHTDGVLDLGDALMVRGAPARRRAALKDARVGVGGIGALFVVYAPALAALAALATDSPARAALALLSGEVAARSAMLLILAFGEPAERDSSSVPFVRKLRGSSRGTGIALALATPALLLVPLKGYAVLTVICVPLVALAALGISRRAFGGISGDVAGATGEAARTAILVLLSATI
jgi:adenosylcobinamide-GDP ribazoletransferase